MSVDRILSRSLTRREMLCLPFAVTFTVACEDNSSQEKQPGITDKFIEIANQIRQTSNLQPLKKDIDLSHIADELAVRYSQGTNAQDIKKLLDKEIRKADFPQNVAVQAFLERLREPITAAEIFASMAKDYPSFSQVITAPNINLAGLGLRGKIIVGLPHTYCIAIFADRRKSGFGF